MGKVHWTSQTTSNHTQQLLNRLKLIRTIAPPKGRHLMTDAAWFLVDMVARIRLDRVVEPHQIVRGLWECVELYLCSLLLKSPEILYR